MARNNNRPDAGCKFRKAATAPAKRVLNLSTMMDCFEFETLVTAAQRCDCPEIELRVIYADYREPGYDAEATMDCIQLHTFFCAIHVLDSHGYHCRREETDGYLSFGRKAVTLKFVKEVRPNDVYPKSSRSN